MSKQSSVSPEVKALVKKAFPNYRGRTIRVYATGTAWIDAYWSGGSRSSYVAINTATGEVGAYAATNPFSDQFSAHSHEIPEGLVIIEHAIFEGKDAGISVHLPKHSALAAQKAIA